MSQSLSLACEKPKLARTKSCPPKGNNVHRLLPFELFLREIWLDDRTKNYMRVTGAKASTAKHRISGKHPPDYAEIAAILRSEHGFKLLKHIMGDARPQWFSGFERAKNIGDLRRRLAAEQRRLAQLEMEIE
jgi:hypothetical protein